jgi:hypothetical protein
MPGDWFSHWVSLAGGEVDEAPAALNVNARARTPVIRWGWRRAGRIPGAGDADLAAGAAAVADFVLGVDVVGGGDDGADCISAEGVGQQGLGGVLAFGG